MPPRCDVAILIRQQSDISGVHKGIPARGDQPFFLETPSRLPAVFFGHHPPPLSPPAAPPPPQPPPPGSPPPQKAALWAGAGAFHTLSGPDHLAALAPLALKNSSAGPGKAFRTGGGRVGGRTAGGWGWGRCSSVERTGSRGGGKFFFGVCFCMKADCFFCGGGYGEWFFLGGSV